MKDKRVKNSTQQDDTNRGTKQSEAGTIKWEKILDMTRLDDSFPVTVEPRYTTTSLIRPPRFNTTTSLLRPFFFCPGKMLMYFLIKLPR